MRISTSWLVALSLAVGALAGEEVDVAENGVVNEDAASQALSFPVIFGSYREVGPVHRDIEELRKERDGGFTDAKQVDRIITRWLAGCPADVYVLVDQPGLRVSDFQQLVTRYEGVTLWDELRRFMSRGGTVGSFPRLSAPLDFGRIENMLTKQCRTEHLVADINGDEPIGTYIDTKPRVIRINFDELPEREYDRVAQLQRNDAKIIDVVKHTPSPFYAVIYSSSTGEQFGLGEEFRKQKHLDIFPDIVRQKRDPRNRDGWKQHEERKPKDLDNGPIKPVPPLAELQRRKQKISDEHRPTQLSPWWSYVDSLLTENALVTLFAANLAILLFYVSFKVIGSLRKYTIQATGAAVVQPAAVKVNPATVRRNTATEEKSH